jgi:S-DNA-T family DNA segregation ATPase FtsK/SpoIIIE
MDQFSEIETTLENMDFDYGDELFWDAVHVVVENQKASVSFLQRKLRVGYARAARLMDLMEERGIVAALDNNKRREILIDKAQLEKLYANYKLC